MPTVRVHGIDFDLIGRVRLHELHSSVRRPNAAVRQIFYIVSASTVDTELPLTERLGKRGICKWYKANIPIRCGSLLVSGNLLHRAKIPNAIGRWPVAAGCHGISSWYRCVVGSREGLIYPPDLAC